MKASVVIPESLTLRLSPFVLRTPAAEDKPAIQRILSDPRNMEHLGYMANQPEGYTEEMIDQRFRAQTLSQKEQRAVCWTVAHESGEIYGTAAINRLSFLSRAGDFGMILDRNAWGTGAAVSAFYLGFEYFFEVLKLHRLELETSVRNPRSQGLCEKLGIRREAIKREMYPEGDGYVDAVTFVLLEQEWPAVKERMIALLQDRNPS